MYTFQHALTQPGCGEDDVMDVQFEMAGRLVPMAELEARLELPTLVQTIRQVINKLEQQPDQAHCPDHQVAPAVLVTVSPSGIGLRVSGCCQTFVDTVQANLRGALSAVHTTSDGLTGLNLVVHLPDWNKAYEFEVGRIDRLVIGRVDPDTGQRPDIDLSAYGAYENGVSRRHASIIRWYQGLYLMDEGSPNGTHLNEHRLLPHLPYMLRFGDKIRIGRLVLEIRLSYPQTNST